MTYDERGTVTQVTKGCRDSTDCTASMYIYPVCQADVSGSSVICTRCQDPPAGPCRRHSSAYASGAIVVPAVDSSVHSHVFTFAMTSVLCHIAVCNVKQEAQLSQRDRAMLRVIEYFAISHSRSFEMTLLGYHLLHYKYSR